MPAPVPVQESRTVSPSCTTAADHVDLAAVDNLGHFEVRAYAAPKADGSSSGGSGSAMQYAAVSIRVLVCSTVSLLPALLWQLHAGDTSLAWVAVEAPGVVSDVKCDRHCGSAAGGLWHQRQQQQGDTHEWTKGGCCAADTCQSAAGGEV